MVVDKEKEKEVEERDKREEARKTTWWERVPALYKMIAAGILFIKYLSLRKAGGNLGELWAWAIVALIVLYFLGSEVKRFNSGLLTPAEAELALKTEVRRKQREGQIPMGVRWFIGPNNGLFHHEGMPEHYIIQMEFMSEGRREYMRGIVFAKGEAKGYATIQASPGLITGREPIPIISPLPAWAKRMQKNDIGLDKVLFRGGRDW